MSISAETHKSDEPQICRVCLSNARARYAKNPEKSEAEHYRDLIHETKHSFAVVEVLNSHLAPTLR